MSDSTRLNLNNTSQEKDVLAAEEQAAREKMEQLKSSRSRIFTATETSTDVSAMEQIETQVTVDEFANVDLNDQSAITQILQKNNASKKDVSAVTVGRMLGLVTSAEFQLLQGKLDLLSSRINNALTKLDKVNQGLANMPTGGDLERIDVQIGALKQMLQDALTGKNSNAIKAPGSEPIASTRIISNDE